MASSYFGGGGGGESEKDESTFQSYVASAQSSMKEVTDQTAGLLGLREKTQYEEMEEACCACCPALTYTQRIYGYLGCLFVSFVLTVGAATRLVELIQGDPAPFAVFYTAQNVTSICASLFLSGPWNQVKKMCDATRYLATSLYFFCMFATLFFVFFTGLPAAAQLSLIFFFIAAQWAALLWYTLSYIPYAREYLASCCGECCIDCLCPCLRPGGADD
mmetsp:Transcript_33076/g.105568  ORF Transcript_33076/g.105568 Transcript_33076/m.105568 type:complete len:218 (+) Transcript_33076:94-747(+)